MSKPAPNSMEASLYERDYYAWTEEQAALLRAGGTVNLDIINLAEEIEDMGRIQRRAVKSALVIVLMHLLKHSFQPQRPTNSWRTSIADVCAMSSPMAQA